MKLFVKRFTPEYEELCEGMTFGASEAFIKTYVPNINSQMNATPKMDEFANKYIILGGVPKVGGGCFIQIPKSC